MEYTRFPPDTFVAGFVHGREYFGLQPHSIMNWTIGSICWHANFLQLVLPAGKLLTNSLPPARRLKRPRRWLSAWRYPNI
jgi:hypothetical protein